MQDELAGVKLSQGDSKVPRRFHRWMSEEPPAVPAVEVHESCPECGSPMKLRQGRKGWFLGCSKYPRCKGHREASPALLEQLTEMGAPS